MDFLGIGAKGLSKRVQLAGVWGVLPDPFRPARGKNGGWVWVGDYVVVGRQLLRGIPRIQGTYQLYTRYTRNVHILTTRGTVGVHICVERRETLDVTAVRQGAFITRLARPVAVLILRTLTSRDN